jgi:hypothetical protein
MDCCSALVRLMADEPFKMVDGVWVGRRLQRKEWRQMELVMLQREEYGDNSAAPSMEATEVVDDIASERKQTAA